MSSNFGVPHSLVIIAPTDTVWNNMFSCSSLSPCPRLPFAYLFFSHCEFGSARQISL